ncbi:hypothetical protein [Nocardioides sp.]|uniref:hypothetical protein n=1 Tax=Nocardioides sp. TaxID=35761 RepID=UPI0026177690|nr:hypothetical protein [Nocardioides sp.]
MTDLIPYDDQLAAQVNALFQRAAATVPAPRADLVDAAIGGAQARLSTQEHARESHPRGRRITGIAASLVLVGGLGAAAGVAATHAGGAGRTTSGTQTRPAAVTSALSAAQMGPTLARTLVAAGQVDDVAQVSLGGAPAWIRRVAGAFDLALSTADSSVRTASATYRQSGREAQVAVMIEHRTTAVPITATVPGDLVGSRGGTVERTDRGIVLTQGARFTGRDRSPVPSSGPAIVSLLIADGTIVRVTTPDQGVVPVTALTAIAQDRAWLG